MVEGKHYSLFILCGEIVIFVVVFNDEWKRRGMCEHFCYGRAKCTN
jgi:hypothetical protein